MDLPEDDDDDDDLEFAYECPVCGDGHSGESGTQLCVPCQIEEDNDDRAEKEN